MASEEETLQYRIDTICLDLAPTVLRELIKTYLKGCSLRVHLQMLNIHEINEQDKYNINEMKKSCHLEDYDFTKLVILINTFKSDEHEASRSNVRKLRRIRNVTIHERSAKHFDDAEESLLSLATFVDSQRRVKTLYYETKTKLEDLKRKEVKLIQQQNKLRDRLRQGNKYVTDFFQPVIITGNISGCQGEDRIREKLDIESALISSKMVMDFDSSSGLRERTEKNNSIFTIRTSENVCNDKHFGDLLSKNPVWVYSNGYDKSSKQEEKVQLKLREWRVKRQKGISKALNEIKTKYAGSIKVIILVFEECEQNDPLFKVIRDMIENEFPDVCDVVVISVEEDHIKEIKRVASEFLYEEQLGDLFLTGIGWDQVSDELKTSFKVNSDINCLLPCRAGNVVVMTKKERSLYTDLEIVSGEECMHEIEEMDKNMRALKMEETKEKFYRGKGISWWNFYFDGQVGKRSAFDDYCRIVKNRLEKGKHVERFEINHNPGAGGTTIGMHILWQFSQFSQASGAANAYRCCKLMKITTKTKDQVVSLCMFKEKENQKPVILLIDDEQEDVLNDFCDELYEEARKHSHVKELCCVVIVKRVPTDMPAKRQVRLVSPRLRPDEQVWFDNKYKELEKEYNAVYVNSLISFNFLKDSYDAKAIQTTADRLMKEVKKDEKNILKCLSVIGTFERERHAVPFRVFDSLMQCSQKNKTWNKCLSEAMDLLITEVQDQDAVGISVISQPLAKAIVDNFKTVEGINLEFLVGFLLDLLTINITGGSYLSQKLKKIIAGLFKREYGRTGSAATEKDDFSALIHKLSEQRINETPESAYKRVLHELERCFELTEDPMVGQQIARFYNQIHKFFDAEQTIKIAINMKPTSSYLLDTYGHIFKTKMSYLIKQGTDKEKKIPDKNASEIIDVTFEAIGKFHEGQTLAFKEHLKITKRNISPLYNELRTVIYLLEKFNTFESYTNHKDLLSFLNEPGFDVGESSYKGLVEQSPKMLDLRQGTTHQVHLMEILQYTRDITNQIKLYKVDSEEGDLLLRFSDRLARFYPDSKITGHCYFTCPIDLKAMMDRMSSQEKRQEVIDSFEASKKNLESEVDEIDDRDLIFYLGYTIIELSGRLPSTGELCSEDEYKKLLLYSKCLIESQTQIPGRILLEVFLYHAMLHWPSDIRLGQDYDNFCPPRQYKVYLKQWEKNFYSNHSLQTIEQKEKNRPKTFFAFGKGSPGNDIINLRVIQQRIWEMEKDDGRTSSGPSSDEVWDEDIVKEQLKSFRGVVNGEGTAISHKITYSNERCSEIEIPMYKHQPELSNREVTFFLGFSWKGPTVLRVKDLDCQDTGIHYGDEASPGISAASHAVDDETGNPDVSPRSQPMKERSNSGQTRNEVVASPDVPQTAVPQKVVRPKTTRAPLKPVPVKDADQSKTVVENILREKPEPIIVSCVCHQLDEARSYVQLIVLYISPAEIYVYHLHEGDRLIADGQLIQLFADKGIHKVFFDIGILSQTLIQQYETILEGNIWDVQVMVDYLSQVDPDNSDRDAKLRFSLWSQENKSLNEELCKEDLDATVLRSLVDRGQRILNIFKQYKRKLDSVRKSYSSDVRKRIFAQAQPSKLAEKIKEIKESQKRDHGKMQKGSVEANSSQAQPKQTKSSKKKKKKSKI